MRRLLGNKTNVSELTKRDRLFYVHYDGQFLGTIAARNISLAVPEAEAKFGKHIIQDRSLLDVADSGKWDGET